MSRNPAPQFLHAPNGILASHSRQAALVLLTTAAVLTLTPSTSHSSTPATTSTVTAETLADRLDPIVSRSERRDPSAPTADDTMTSAVSLLTKQVAASQRNADARQAAADAQAASEAAAIAAAEAAEEAAARAAAEAAEEARRANGTPAEYKDYARTLVGSDQFGCLERLWGRESGWDNHAQNPGSTAYGIAQFLNSTWKMTGIAKTSDAYRQIDAGLVYLDRAYGSPCGGWAHSQATGWY